MSLTRHRYSMRRLLHIVVALVTPLLAGCPPEVIPLRAPQTIVRSYRIGERFTVAPGGTIASVRRMTAAPMFEVAFDYEPPQHDLFQGGLDYPRLKKGMRFVQVATRADGAIGLERIGYGITRPGSFANRDTYMPVTIWVKDGVVSGSMEGRGWTDDMLFLPVTSSGVAEAARSELVFDGIDGTMLNATWREYLSGPDAPTETRPVRFDIGSRRTLEHQGLAIEVTSATPEAIELRITDDSSFLWTSDVSGS